MESTQLLDSLVQTCDANGMPVLHINNPFGHAEIYLFGAHVSAWQPTDKDEVFWLSSDAVMDGSKAIRGGVPVCWPWFGPAWEADQPQHGFARTSQFSVLTSRQTPDFTEVILRREASGDAGQDALQLDVTIALGRSLCMQLRTVNTGKDVLPVGAAFHNYFAVSDIAEVEISGLSDALEIDGLSGLSTWRTDNRQVIDGEYDRIYMGGQRQVQLRDAASRREILVQLDNQADLVVWNPWIEKAASMGDFNDQGYRNMMCLEPALTNLSAPLLEPSAAHVFTQEIFVTDF